MRIKFYSYCCRASARQHTILDVLAFSRPVLPAELYIVEISIRTGEDVGFPGHNVFKFVCKFEGHSTKHGLDPWTGPKIGPKIGLKIGPKIGPKIGLKIGLKILAKILPKNPLFFRRETTLRI